MPGSDGGSLIFSRMFRVMWPFCNRGLIHGSNCVRDSRERMKMSRNDSCSIEVTPDEGEERILQCSQPSRPSVFGGGRNGLQSFMGS